jgi:hypothetical protein
VACRVPHPSRPSRPSAGFDFPDCLKEPFERFSTANSTTTT